ncbi:hypothetical protein PoB_001656300 [Plakobranchus ocellatus]|uniref:Uncharacterized protein n=1 Tax=Plakobranchus ocellatus TaxID=259542 RepID=A0AAV3Z5X4_9GAST|nr:hypothetical protein PoB_001656300 [Plakobranchus ocellatus]
MAEVANSRGASSQSSTNSSSDMIPDPPEELVLSPSMKAAMDRILPCSASQLLQHKLSLDEDSLGRLPQMHSDSSQQKRNSTVPPGNFAGNKNQRLSLQNGSFLSAELNIIKENGDVGNCMQEKPGGQSSIEKQGEKKSGARKKISRADLEVITAGDAAAAGFHERTSRRSSFERPSSDVQSKAGSDSDDVSRPFAVVREKRKEKRRRKKNHTHSTEESHNGSVSVGDSDNDFVSDRHKEKPGHICKEKSKAISELPLSDIAAEPIAGKKTFNGGGHALGLPGHELSTLSTSYVNKYLQGPHGRENLPLSDDMSNNSFSSTKENFENKIRVEHQKLPRVKLPCFHMAKHKNKIRKTFPPCFVVIEQISALLTQADSRVLNLAHLSQDGSELPGKVLPLSVRLKNLSRSCAKGLISCRKQKRDKKIAEAKKNADFGEISILDSEDDFEVSRGGRSLRKRDKTISYVEPTEADIFLEYSRKRSRSKTKEDSEEVKRRKLNAPTEEPTVLNDKSDNSKNDKNLPSAEALAKDKNKRLPPPPLHDYARARPANGGVQEVVIYPKAPVGKESSSKGKSKTIEIRPAIPVSSVAPTTIIQSMLSNQHMSGLISRFPPYLTSMPTSSGMLSASTMSSSLTGAGITASTPVRPQFCMVKMDGKDVLLQVLPPSAPGAASQGSTLLLPGGKRLVVPPSHHLSQQISRAPRLMTPFPSSTMPMPLTSPLPPGLTAAPVISTISTQRLPLTIPSVSTSQNLSVQATSSSSSSRTAPPRTLIPVTVYPPTSAAVTASAPAPPRTATLTSSTTRPLPVSSVSMAAPYSTSVVRNICMSAPNLRAAVPNQPTSVRSVRIFVPGCQATGMPSRFATLGSVTATSNALTRLSASSDLLPQRKQANDKLTPEQRAEKRRKLEKKYPLPPGVVIKTEPLESPSHTQSSASYGRSLLPGSIQVLSTARRPGMQSIRFANPASLSSGSFVPLTNFIVRAASGDGRQTILIPSSLGMLTTGATARSSGTSVSSVSSVGSTLSSSSSASSTSIIVTTVSSTLGGTISILSSVTSAVSTCSTTVTTSCASGPVSSQAVLQPPGALPSSPSAQTNGSVIAKLKTEIEAMNKLLVAQEAMGLRGARVEKLKELLKKKEDTLKNLLERPENDSAASASTNLHSNLDPPESSGSANEHEVIEID